MAWVKLDDQFPINHKTRALTIEARYLYVTSLCWCAMQTNDGTFPASDTPTVAALAGVPPTIAGQLSPTLWHPEGFDCEACAEVGQAIPVPSGHITIHCYLERNESRDQIERRRREDRKRKQRARSDRESADLSPPDSVRNPRGSPAVSPTVSSRPVPNESLLTSSRNSRANGATADDDDLSTAVPDETWHAYAEIRLRQQTNVKNPGPWKTRTANNARLELADQATTWWHMFDITPRRLAEALADGQAPRGAKRRDQP